MKRHPYRHCLRSAFTVVEMLIVIAVIAIVAGLLLPALDSRHDRQRYMRIRCTSNLKGVGLSYRLWAGDNGGYPMAVYTNAAGEQLFANGALAYRYFQVLSNELSNPAVLLCPDDQKHEAATNFTSDFNGSHISYFVGLEADERFPQLFLAGDMNLTNSLPFKNGIMKVTPKNPASWTAERHGGAGNIAFADGSVQQFNNSQLRKYFQDYKITERLLMPDAGATK